MHTFISTQYAHHPADVKNYDTADLRKHFLIEKLFVADQINGVYTLADRLIVGGIHPVNKALDLETVSQLKSEYFLERREMGIINVGAPTKISLDEEIISLGHKEALYLGKGVQKVVFHPSESGMAYLYFNSAPAHHKYPNQQIKQEEAEVVTLGNTENANQRVIYKLLVNSIIKTCQLQMGMTTLKPGSVWNTMPAHTHDRRMEAYFYLDLPEDQAVCHLMGQPEETRHIWIKNHQAVISPPWSVHSGAGTSNYTFIWGMAGENLDYSDMDAVEPTSLR